VNELMAKEAPTSKVSRNNYSAYSGVNIEEFNEVVRPLGYESRNNYSAYSGVNTTVQNVLVLKTYTRLEITTPHIAE